MTDKDDTVPMPLRPTPVPRPPLPKCDKCGKILLHCTCGERELKK